MSFLTELKARSKRGPGSVSITFPDSQKPIVIPLRYPTARAQAEFVAFMSEVDDDVKGVEAAELNIKIIHQAVQACVKTDEPIDDATLTMMVQESGGHTGELVERCMQLLGLGAAAKGGSKRGR